MVGRRVCQRGERLLPGLRRCYLHADRDANGCTDRDVNGDADRDADRDADPHARPDCLDLGPCPARPVRGGGGRAIASAPKPSGRRCWSVKLQI